MTRYALPARRKSAECGIDHAGKTARQLTHSDYDERNSLTGTDLANIPIIRHIFGDVGGKKRLLLDYTGHPGDVTGPWYTDDFETT